MPRDFYDFVAADLYSSSSSESDSDSSSTSPTPYQLCEAFLNKKIALARAGHLSLKLSEYLHRHHTYLSPREFAKLTLVGLWCAQLNLGRKGDASRLLSLGTKIFGSAELDLVVNEAISLGVGDKEGFGRIDLEKFLGFQKDVCWEKPRKKGVTICKEDRLDLHMSQKLFAVVWGAMIQLGRMGDASIIEEMGRDDKRVRFDVGVSLLVRYTLWGQRTINFERKERDILRLFGGK